MTKRALAIGWGGFADLDLTFGEFFAKKTIRLRFGLCRSIRMLQPARCWQKTAKVLRVRRGGSYRSGRGGPKGDKFVLGSSMIFVQAGDTQVVYEVSDHQVPGLVDKTGGPVRISQRVAAPGSGAPARPRSWGTRERNGGSPVEQPDRPADGPDRPRSVGCGSSRTSTRRRREIHETWLEKGRLPPEARPPRRQGTRRPRLDLRRRGGAAPDRPGPPKEPPSI